MSALQPPVEGSRATDKLFGLGFRLPLAASFGCRPLGVGQLFQQLRWFADLLVVLLQAQAHESP